MNPKGEKQNNELQDIREILGVIVERMVTKEEFNAFLDRMVTKEEFAAFEAETRQNFRDVREDIAGLRKETEFEFDDLLGRVKYLEQKPVSRAASKNKNARFSDIIFSAG
jgi:hypothetical protein